MQKINFQDGTLVSPAKVTIDGTEHQVTPAQYSGTTPISKRTLNLMQDNIEEEIDLNKIHIYTMKITADTELGAEITLPFYYKVGNGSLFQVQYLEWILLKAIDSDTQGQYYEYGEANSLSNKIQLASDAKLKQR